jgi:hypothetical protein
MSLSDFLVGQKGDGKCPKDVMVAIRLNGFLLSKRRTVRTTQPLDSGANSRVLKSYANLSPVKSPDIEASIHESYTRRTEKRISPIKVRTQFSDDLGPYLTDYERFKLPLEKRMKPKGLSILYRQPARVPQDTVPMKHGGSIILKQVDPQISLMTLGDGSGRVVCETAGCMRGCSIHMLLSMAARGLGNVCCVCWMGSDASDILECVDCGLLVHLECCLDKGNVMMNHDQKMWRCAVCSESVGLEDTKSLQKYSNRKSSRTSKLPSRFLENPTDIMDQALDSELYHKKVSRERPCHKCTMCPHSGETV